MKQLLTLIAICAMGLNALAQTNFRPISLNEALAAAKQENKMVFVDFYTDWCGPCKKMAREVFPQKKVGDYLNAKFVCIKLNAEKEGKADAQQYKVKAYPTFIVMDAKGEVLVDIKGSMEADQFINKIETGMNPENTPTRLAERYNAGERTPDLVNKYAMSLMEQKKEAEGFKVINDYFNSLTDKQRTAKENLFIYTIYTFDLKDPKAQFMVAHYNEFDASVKEAVSERLNRLHRSVLNTYLSGYMFKEGKYTAEEYEALKKSIIQLGMDKTYPFAPVFRIIESRAKDNDRNFWEVCKQEHANLNAADQNLLILNYSRLFNLADKELLKDMSQFIRSQLNTMRPDMIAASARFLETIEPIMKK